MEANLEKFLSDVLESFDCFACIFYRNLKFFGHGRYVTFYLSDSLLARHIDADRDGTVGEIGESMRVSYGHIDCLDEMRGLFNHSSNQSCEGGFIKAEMCL